MSKPSGSPILVADHVTKSFPGVLALDGVDFTICAGEVNALVGENGAGKSTLIKLMAGFYSPDGGELRVNGALLEANPAAAHLAGVATIHQEHNLIPNMTVGENIMLGRWPSRLGLISEREQRAAAERALKRVAPGLSPGTIARRLSPAEGQLVEIARALSENSQVVIMDEPTTSLSPPEVDRLIAVVKDLRQHGLGIVFVSHWLDEVFRVSDRITVLRDGRFVKSVRAADSSPDDVIRMMVGRDLAEPLTALPRTPEKTVLEVRNLTRAGYVEDVSFTVRAGEIVTLAGLVGAGRSELASCIFGIDRYDTGEVLVDGRKVPPGDPNAAIAAGIGLVPEDRRRQALVGTQSVAENITLSVFDLIAPRGWLDFAAENEIVARESRALAIKMASPNARVSTLSGGNQQKVVLARWLARKPRLLILDEPTKGIDVGAKAEISELVLRLAERGVAILLISSELPEVLSLSDRVLVMRSGRLAGELCRQELSGEAVMNYAVAG